MALIPWVLLGWKNLEDKLWKQENHHIDFTQKRYKSHLPRVFVAVDFPTSFWGYGQWIGLRENLQETIDLTTQYGVIWGFAVNFPLNQSIAIDFPLEKRCRFGCRAGAGGVLWVPCGGNSFPGQRCLQAAIWWDPSGKSVRNPHGNPPFYHFPMVKSTILRFYWCTLWLCQQFANLKMAQSK